MIKCIFSSHFFEKSLFRSSRPILKMKYFMIFVIEQSFWNRGSIVDRFRIFILYAPMFVATLSSKSSLKMKFLKRTSSSVKKIIKFDESATRPTSDSQLMYQHGNNPFFIREKGVFSYQQRL